MTSRLLLSIALTIIAAVSSVSFVLTTPQALTARRMHQRFAAESQAQGDSTLARSARRLMARAGSTRMLSPLQAFIATRQRQRLDRQIPDALDRVVRQLRSGSTLSLSLAEVGEVEPVFAQLAKELSQGQSVSHAVGIWRLEDDLPNRQLTATALELASTAGGASARVLDGVATTLRDRRAVEREVTALSSQARASAVVLVFAPLVFATMAAAFDDRILEVLIGRPIGWACIGLGLGLDGIGALWMARLIGRHQ